MPAADVNPTNASNGHKKIPKPLEDRVGGHHKGGTLRAGTKQHGHKAPSGSGGHKYEWKDRTNDGTFRRPAVLRCLYAINATRVHLTMKWVVSFLISRPFGPL